MYPLTVFSPAPLTLVDLALGGSALLPPCSSSQVLLSCHCSAPMAPDITTNQVDGRQRQPHCLGTVVVVQCSASPRTGDVWLLSLLLPASLLLRVSSRPRVRAREPARTSHPSRTQVYPHFLLVATSFKTTLAGGERDLAGHSGVPMDLSFPPTPSKCSR